MGDHEFGDRRRRAVTAIVGRHDLVFDFRRRHVIDSWSPLNPSNEKGHVSQFSKQPCSQGLIILVMVHHATAVKGNVLAQVPSQQARCSAASGSLVLDLAGGAEVWGKAFMQVPCCLVRLSGLLSFVPPGQNRDPTQCFPSANGAVHRIR